MAEWMNRKSFLLVMSFILTIFLFALATDANGGLRSSSLNPQSSSNTISNVPIYVDINSDEYAVTGLPDSVALRLEVLVATVKHNRKWNLPCENS